MRSWRVFFRTGTLPQTKMEVWKMIFPDFQVPAVGFPLILAHQNSKPQKGKSTAVTYSLRSFRPFLERKEKMDLQNGPMRIFAQRSAYFLFKLAYLPGISCENHPKCPTASLRDVPWKLDSNFLLEKGKTKKILSYLSLLKILTPETLLSFFWRCFNLESTLSVAKFLIYVAVLWNPGFKPPRRKSFNRRLMILSWLTLHQWSGGLKDPTKSIGNGMVVARKQLGLGFKNLWVWPTWSPKMVIF